MEDFDFVKAFAGVDLLAVEAIGKVVGRALGVLYQGMVEVGVSEEDAHRILRSAFVVLVGELRRPTKEGGES